MHTQLLLALAAVCSGSEQQQTGATSPPFTPSGGLHLEEGWSQPTPVQIEVVKADGSVLWLKVQYASVVVGVAGAPGAPVATATATVLSPAGSVFRVTDVYKVATSVEVVLNRTVTIINAATTDVGFSSRWSLYVVVVGNWVIKCSVYYNPNPNPKDTARYNTWHLCTPPWNANTYTPRALHSFLPSFLPCFVYFFSIIIKTSNNPKKQKKTPHHPITKQQGCC